MEPFGATLQPNSHSRNTKQQAHLDTQPEHLDAQHEHLNTQPQHLDTQQEHNEYALRTLKA